MPLTSFQMSHSQLRLEWSTDASAAQIWALLTEPGCLSQWLGELVSGTVSSGSSFVVDHGDGYRCESTVVEYVAERRLRHTWEFPGEHLSEVCWELRPDVRGTRLTLTHAGLEELLASYRDGWLVHLTYLEAAALGTPLATTMFWNLHSTFARLNAANDGSSRP